MLGNKTAHSVNFETMEKQCLFVSDAVINAIKRNLWHIDVFLLQFYCRKCIVWIVLALEQGSSLTEYYLMSEPHDTHIMFVV